MKQQLDTAVELGLRQNLSQFILLALVNITVGGLVGLERTTTPESIDAQSFTAQRRND